MLWIINTWTDKHNLSKFILRTVSKTYKSVKIIVCVCGCVRTTFSFISDIWIGVKYGGLVSVMWWFFCVCLATWKLVGWRRRVYTAYWSRQWKPHISRVVCLCPWITSQTATAIKMRNASCLPDSNAVQPYKADSYLYHVSVPCQFRISAVCAVSGTGTSSLVF
jgi:hypothetical protein